MKRLFQKIGKFNRIRREQGMEGLRLHAEYFKHRRGERAKYKRWVEANAITGAMRAEMRGQMDGFAVKPLISIVLPVYNVDEKYLRACIESVIGQIYPHWELCIADDASPAPHIKTVLAEFAARDERIKVNYRDKNGHISAASNSALELAAGEFTALLDHDDVLTEDALFWVAAEINAYPDVAMIYSDEDKIDAAGARSEPKFKPDWSRDLFYSLNLITHLSVYKTSVLREVGAFREGFEGSQDHDLALRVIEKIPENSIRHIPRILYHWRAIPGSVALTGEAKPYAYEKAREALREHFERTGVHAEVVEAADNLHRVHYTLPNPVPKASIISLVETEEEAAGANEIYLATSYSDLEMLLVCPPELVREFAELPNNIRVIPGSDLPPAGRYSLAALQADGEVMCFVDPSLKPLSPAWLEEMAGFVVQDGIGAVGARISGKDRSVLHTGLVIGDDVTPFAAHWGNPDEEPGYFFRSGLVGNYSAVSIAAFATSRTVYMQTGGFDVPRFPAHLFDVDYCLKMWKNGLRVVYTPYAGFVHSSPAQKLPFDVPPPPAEKKAFAEKWKKAAESDPFYNPNLSRANGHFEIDI